MENDQTGHTSHLCLAKGREVSNETTDKHHSRSTKMMSANQLVTKKTMILLIFKMINEDGLNFSTAISRFSAPPDRNEVSSFHLEIKQQQIPENDEESVGEQVHNPIEALDPTLRRSTTTRNAPDRIEHYAMVAVEAPGTLKKAMESSNGEQWKQAVTEVLKST